MSTQSENTTADVRHQFATFNIGELLFGVDVHDVQEVIRFQPMTPVPLTSPVIRGLINLRGQIITAIDMRRRLNSNGGTKDEDTMNVIVQLDEERVSLVVDSVGDVLELSHDSFEPIPANVVGELRNLVKGVHKLSDKLLLVLNTKAALTL